MGNRHLLAGATSVALLVLAGCGDDAPPPPAPSPTEALWNPCDALSADDLGRRLGGELAEEDGSATQPQCTFTPRADGDPVLDSNYQIFPEGLEAAFESMGRPESAAVSTPRVPGADDTRLVVDVDADNLYVSGFVQNGDLIQTVDVVDPAPHERQRVERAVVWALGRLADQAREAGIR